ncbi:MAG: hypothetical protein EOP52_11425 [Sphingobacteriales bacterium]|nr:MAG: hypothetical protein EOP52_11425 [Sphingobacteriales bacterium]
MTHRMTIYVALVLCSLAACNRPLRSQPVAPALEHSATSVTLPESPTDLKRLAKTVVQSLKNQDYQALEAQVHPRKGVLFSPYGFIDTGSAVWLPKAVVAQTFTRDTARLLLWGFQDGSGDSLVLTPTAYLRRYGYGRDFAGSDSVLLNQMPLRGNSLNNLKDVFPDADVVEYFDAGTEEMDWRVLRLVFQPFEGRLYLVAIVNDEWTI